MPRPNILNFFFKICVTDNSGSPYGGQILWWDGRPASRADAKTTRVVSIDLNSALKKLFFVQRSISTTKLNSYPPSPPSRTEFLAPKILVVSTRMSGILFGCNIIDYTKRSKKNARHYSRDYYILIKEQ